MANKGIGKIIGYGIAGILTIGGATVVITNEDIAQQYKINTGEELRTNKIKLVSFEESMAESQGAKEVFENFYKIRCSDDDEEHYSICKRTYDVINALDNTIICDENIIKNNLEKSDIQFCISSNIEFRDAIKNLYIEQYGYCNDNCQSSINNTEYDIAMFQAYLNKLD